MLRYVTDSVRRLTTRKSDLLSDDDEKQNKGNINSYEDGNISHGDEKDTGKKEYERGQWGNKMEFILSCVGLSVGLGNVWRFPYLAYAHGGASFLIAYLILQILIGKPMYMMELIMGQYSGRGPTGVWNMNPSAKGIGISMALISMIVAIYYNVIMAYTLYYFFASMQSTLPWTKCKSEWLQDGCVEQTMKKIQECTGNWTFDSTLPRCLCTTNYKINAYLSDHNVTCSNTSYRAVADMYFNKEVIQKSAGIDPENVGKPLWKLSLLLLLSWIIVVCCLIKGVKSSGKVVYFTATFPYVILLILLFRGATLDGAIDGVLYFVVPKWEKLIDVDVWAAAAGQMFFSLSVSFGGIIMFGSYNKFKNNVYGDALFISMMDLVTSVIAGFVIFTTFGGMAKKIGVSVEDVAQSGYGLAFIAYPEALSNLPPSQLWSILFFFMLFTLGLDSEFALLETTMTCIQDEYPKLRKYKSYLCVGFGIVLYLCALPCVTPAGDYVVTIMDSYGADFSVLYVAVFECIAVMWVYGVKNFVRDATYMLGRPPRPKYFWIFCWAVCSPVLIGALVIYRMVKYKPPEITKNVPYPVFAQGIGWALTAFVLCPVPIYFVYKFVLTPGSFLKRLRTITSPNSEWGPNDKQDTKPLYPTFQMSSKFGVDNPADQNQM